MIEVISTGGLEVKLQSKEVNEIRKSSTLKLLFIKKNDDEGSEFYFMGAVNHENSISNTISSNGKKLSIVEVFYSMSVPVEPKIYNYFED